MYALIFGILAVLVVCFLTGVFNSRRDYPVPKENESNSRGDLNANPGMPLKRKKIMSAAETCFYQILIHMLPQGKAISVKVRLEDIMFVIPCRNKFWYRQKINCRHVDFVIFNPQNGMVDFCIELDDSSHQDRQDADKNKDSFFRSARIPLIRIPVQYTYDPRDVAKKILNVMRESESPYFMADYAYHWDAHFFHREQEWR